MSVRLPDIKPGDPIRAKDFMALVAAVRAMQLSVAPPLQTRSGPSGITLTLAAALGAKIAKTTGTITAKSGTPGTLGTGDIQLHDASATGVLTAGAAAKGWNLASNATTGPIASGVWIVVLKVDALWLIIWEECA